MAVQLSTAGEEPIPAAGAIRMAYCGDEHGEGVKLSGEEPLPLSWMLTQRLYILDSTVDVLL